MCSTEEKTLQSKGNNIVNWKEEPVLLEADIWFLISMVWFIGLTDTSPWRIKVSEPFPFLSITNIYSEEFSQYLINKRINILGGDLTSFVAYVKCKKINPLPCKSFANKWFYGKGKKS